MTAEDILNKTSSFMEEGKLKENEEYLIHALEECKNNNDYSLQLTILNEQAGFYRDIGKMNKAVEACLESELILDKINEGDTIPRASAYLNTANVYRASKEYDKSYEYFQKAFSIIEKCGDDSLYSSYYNNMALLHQENDKFEDAANCLKKALYIAEDKMHDDIRTAITRTNLASTFLRLKRLEEAEECLKGAIKIFEGRNPSDFHYCAALSALADLCLLRGQFEESVNYFEMALSEIDFHMGENNFYSIVEDNLDKAMELLARKKTMDKGREVSKESFRKIKGLELSKKYFEAFGKPILLKNFSHLLEKIACGMAGDGSECLGLDDEISTDHDFAPGFCIFITEDVSEADAKALASMYENLPKKYMGKRRLETIEGQGRVGVIRIKDFLKKATGFDHIPKGSNEWQYTVDENLVTFVNGEIFMDKAGIMTKLRKHINEDQPMFVYCRKLAMQLELMAKHGQYSYKRALDRGDMTSALLSKAEFLKATMRCINILNRKYAPYSKWLRKSLDALKCTNSLKEDIDQLSASAVTKNDLPIIERICNEVRSMVNKRGLADSKESFLKVQAMEIASLANRSIIADNIVDLEWMLFDKVDNEGGRASCQDDWGTFSIMRRSQYYSWPEELLNMLLTDYTQAVQSGRNIITEKYGYMMESTAPEEFDLIKDKLPVIDDDKKKIIEAIIGFQVNWMENFSKDYPKLSKNARNIHTYEDTPFMTSYETYLRGELSTYHDDTLILYGRFIAELMNRGENLARKIMNLTTFFYGYSSLEEAEGNG